MENLLTFLLFLAAVRYFFTQINAIATLMSNCTRISSFITLKFMCGKGNRNCQEFRMKYQYRDSNSRNTNASTELKGITKKSKFDH